MFPSTHTLVFPSIRTFNVGIDAALDKSHSMMREYNYLGPSLPFDQFSVVPALWYSMTPGAPLPNVDADTT